MSKKKVDQNGFETYRDCKFFCECVSQYLGSEIDQDGKLGLKPKGIYNVYRPKAEIEKAEFIESLNAKPVLDDHHVIGNVKGLIDPDKRREAGVLTEVKLVGNELRGRIDIWSPSMIKKIRDGKRELSLAYACDFVAKKGVFKGERYDFIQSNLKCGNHLALVDVARNGHDCRIMDGMLVRDETIQLEKTDMDITKLSADEVVEALKGCSDEVRAKCKDFLNTPTEEEKKAAEDKAKAEEEAKKKAEEEAAKKAEEDKKAAEAKAAEDAKAAEEAAKKVEEDKAKACEDAVNEYKEAEQLACDCAPVFGKIAMDGIKTKTDLVKHICDMQITEPKALKVQKIVKDSKPEEALAALKGSIAMVGGAKTIVSDAKTVTKQSFKDYRANR
jgi:hypothetical protein